MIPIDAHFNDETNDKQLVKPLQAPFVEAKSYGITAGKLVECSLLLIDQRFCYLNNM